MNERFSLLNRNRNPPLYVLGRLQKSIKIKMKITIKRRRQSPLDKVGLLTQIELFFRREPLNCLSCDDEFFAMADTDTQ